MTTGLARVTGNRYYGKQLGLCMASTVKTGSPPKDRYASVMKDLNEIFEVSTRLPGQCYFLLSCLLMFAACASGLRVQRYL